MEDLKYKIGFDLELLYYIKIIEQTTMSKSDVMIMRNIWYGYYDDSEKIIVDKKQIHSALIDYLVENELKDNLEKELIITATKELFKYFDNKIVMNKLINPYDNCNEIYKYDIDLLYKNPEHAREYLYYQVISIGC